MIIGTLHTLYFKNQCYKLKKKNVFKSSMVIKESMCECVCERDRERKRERECFVHVEAPRDNALSGRVCVPLGESSACAALS